MNTDNMIVELPAIIFITRGIWRSVSQSTKSVYVEKVVSEKVTENEQEK